MVVLGYRVSGQGWSFLSFIMSTSSLEQLSQYVCEKQTEAETIKGVHFRMLDAVRVRLRADVAVGIYLSGGLGCSVIIGMVTHLVKDQGERVGNELGTNRANCFRMASGKDSGFDESCKVLCSWETRFCFLIAGGSNCHLYC